MFDIFMTKFFPPSMTTELRATISSYHMHEDKTFATTWERYKDLIRQCLTHGQPDHVLQQIFYQGVNDTIRARIDTHTDCEFLIMDFIDAWAIIEKITTHNSKYALSRYANVSG